jgi:hypothetical protein
MLKVLIVLFCLGLLSCSSSAPAPKPVNEKDEKIEMGFRFLPPQGKDWSVFNTMGFKGYSYAKKLPSVDPKNHSVIFSVIYGFMEQDIKNADEALQYAKSNKEAQLRNGRFVMKKNANKIISYKGTKCLEYDSMVLDKMTSQNMTYNGMFCTHPQDFKRYVDISHSQRFDVNRTKIAIPAEEYQFLKSVEFIKL